jgi:hypothetical protein
VPTIEKNVIIIIIAFIIIITMGNVCNSSAALCGC